jgi:hypothetical protein
MIICSFIQFNRRNAEFSVVAFAKFYQDLLDFIGAATPDEVTRVDCNETDACGTTSAN